MKDKLIGSSIDNLGRLLAERAALDATITKLRKKLIELGDGAHEGELFRVAVYTQKRKTLDLAAVRKKLSRQFIAANTKVKEQVCIQCTSRGK
jgi:hypothetical protein